MSETKKDWKAIHREEAAQFVSGYYRTCWDWRAQGYHTNWDIYERNYNNIYDPTAKSKKEEWQATLFTPLTITHCEVIYTGLIKLLLGRKRPISIEAREMGDQLQSELNTSLLDYEIDKSGLHLAFGQSLKDATIFGNGFLKCYWEKKYAPRRIRKPVYEDIEVARAEGLPPLGKKKGEKIEVEKVLIKDSTKWEYVPIRDIFLEPNSIDMDRVLHRQKNITYSQLKEQADAGVFDKDVVKQLFGVSEADTFEKDQAVILYELGITDPELPRPSYDQKHTVFEFWGPIPRKWIDLDMPEDTEEQKEKANEIVPGKIMTASGKFFLASEENPNQSMEPPFVKVPYIISGRTYDIGVGQLLCGIQDDINELTNQRIDNVVMCMNKIFLALEKSLVDLTEVRSKPHAVIRIKGTLAEGVDVRKVIAELPVSEVGVNAYRETQERERMAQEVTAANRVTTGTAGQTNDTNQTLGGMELLKQAAFDRFTVYAYQIGRKSLITIGQKTMEYVYQYSSPERIKRILGMMPVKMINFETGEEEIVAKWMAFRPIPPHELVLDYDFKVVDVFAMENRAAKRQALAANMQLTASLVQQFDPRPGLRKLFEYDEFAPEEIEEILKGIDGPQPTPLAMGQGVPSIAKPVKTSLGDGPPSKVPGQPAPGMAPGMA
jgi:hypothetical protein